MLLDAKILTEKSKETLKTNDEFYIQENLLKIPKKIRFCKMFTIPPNFNIFCSSFNNNQIIRNMLMAINTLISKIGWGTDSYTPCGNNLSVM